jgi:site-specific DNA recombinase
LPDTDQRALATKSSRFEAAGPSASQFVVALSVVAAMQAVIRVALYGRYSTDLQNPTSVDDQFRVCGEYAARQPCWKITGTYRDEAITGTTLLLRPDVQALLDDAASDKFDVVLIEALHRLTRDLADAAALYKRLRFYGVKLVTTRDGENSRWHVAINGAVAEAYIDDLIQNVRRGISGKVLRGKFFGPAAYGYAVKKHVDAAFEPIRGDRQINPKTAAIVVRIFTEYANGIGPTEIVRRLNADEIPSPRGGVWQSAVITGYKKRGTGIINNEIYIGRLVWNKNSCPRHPDTAHKVIRHNSPDKWVVAEVPELRIISDDLWAKVKDKQRELSLLYKQQFQPMDPWRTSAIARNATHRAKTLFRRLECACCGGRYSIRGNRRYACRNHRVGGTCANGRTILRSEVEERVLGALIGPFLEPKSIDEAMKAFVQEVERENQQWASDHTIIRRRIEDIDKRNSRLADVIEGGEYSEIVSARLEHNKQEKAELEKRLAARPPQKIVLPPPDEYHRKMENLVEALNRSDEFSEAAQSLNQIVRRIVIAPKAHQLRKKRDTLPMFVYVNLAGLLGLNDDQASTRSAFVIRV